MGCGKNRVESASEGCVCDILKEIVDAQNDVTDDCNSSCEESINELMGDRGTNKDTVPVILYCKDCKPFKGFGARRNEIDKIRESFIFRVKEVDEDCECALLELLATPHSSEECHIKSPSDQDTSNLRATGICITVDLNCFCHITCLPAINARA
ncbi:CotY/CotZ family spore coat protein [Pontibacillus salipaludis]|uniref:Spore coat protein n=1 Tax=Pontibacillus salipaludis TaxID=1697394 RepID=A0ABQ1Q8L2_9BACI|nr:CotY/CotZ family spore coat protein [Pontibacillus salipaludis]GGD18421.1 spore coat protein [Pontibacillus salipaludis]